ncbi:MAG: hypothetical protein KatS3mg024_0167 [Armatimonadota bacterium]|nr:MAG: hypothetical protein KatS3mg024_0167 [Armatimonadota bacterium]
MTVWKAVRSAATMLSAVLVAAAPSVGGQFAIDWAVLSGGGGEMSSASYRLNGSLGQGFAGYASSASYQHWAGFWVEPGSIAPPQPVVVQNLEQAKVLADGTHVQVNRLVATTWAGAFGSNTLAYLEQEDRASGIRVVLASPAGWLGEGARVSVTGVMSTTPDQERQISSAALTLLSAGAPLEPLRMTNRALGGGDLGVPPLGQAGVTGGHGVNNVGLLVVVWGTVVNDPSAGYTLLDDGSGTPVRVETGHLAVLWSQGDYLKVTGLSSLRKNGEILERLIIPRSNADVSGI